MRELTVWAEKKLSAHDLWTRTCPDGVRLDWSGGEFKGINLVGRNLRMANLARICLDESDLAGADLTGAIMTCASLQNTSLVGANSLSDL